MKVVGVAYQNVREKYTTLLRTLPATPIPSYVLHKASGKGLGLFAR